MSDKTQQLDARLKEVFNKTFSEEALTARFDSHVETLKDLSSDLAEKTGKVLEASLDTLLELSQEQDPEKSTRLQKRLAAFKRAHLNYLKATEVEASWRTAQEFWFYMDASKKVLVELIRFSVAAWSADWHKSSSS